MVTLYSYCIPYDDGAAPNPYWGVCTLVICKPKIRKAAQKGDWIVGTGSARYGTSGMVVYAMEVTDTMTMKEYDRYCQSKLPSKIPDWTNFDVRRRLGDCIYDFVSDPPTIREGVHNSDNRERDLRGGQALLSTHFFYFGNRPIALPDDLRPIIKKGQGHRAQSNGQYVQLFIQWIHSLDRQPNSFLEKPQLDLFLNKSLRDSCSKGRCTEADDDEKLPDDC
ncbi:MAG: hypothetical protein WCE94_08575 [Candidatus Methanoperedens sp.]